MNAPPTGFEPHKRKSPLTEPWEPLFACDLEDRTILGLFVGPAHANSRGFLHGGLIATLADNAMGLSCGKVLKRGGGTQQGLVTISLGVDYLGRAEMGQWLTFDTFFVRPGRTISFAEAEVSAEGAPVARARATLRAV